MNRNILPEVQHNARGLLRVLGCAAGDRGGHRGNRPLTQNERRVQRLIALLESPSGVANPALSLDSESAQADMHTMLAIVNTVAAPEGEHVKECAKYLDLIRKSLHQLLGLAPPLDTVEIDEDAGMLPVH